jgi:hypothetical protein
MDHLDLDFSRLVFTDNEHVKDIWDDIRRQIQQLRLEYVFADAVQGALIDVDLDFVFLEDLLIIFVYTMFSHQKILCPEDIMSFLSMECETLEYTRDRLEECVQNIYIELHKLKVQNFV